MPDAPEIIPLRCGTIKAPANLFEADGVGESTAPVYAFLITHPRHAPVLFDTGLHPDLHGKLAFDAYANTVPAKQTVSARLEQVGIGAGALGAVILSHSHYDHAGGLPLIGDAPVYIHRDEELGRIDVGRDIRRTGDLFDLFGDGSVEVFATPGHTAGHQSLRVRRFGGHDVLAVDACYFCRSLTRIDADQPYAFDKPLFIETKRRLARMQADGDFVVPGHDAAFLDQIPSGSAIRVHAASLAEP